MRTLDSLYRAQRAARLMLEPIRAELVGLVRRAVVGKTTAESGDTARSRGTTFGDVATDGEQLQQYGVASNPPADSEGLYFPRHGVMICVDSRAGRPALAEGEVALWSCHEQILHLKSDGSIEVTSQSGSTVVMPDDGSIEITTQNGSTVTMDASGNIAIEPSGAGLVNLAGAVDFVALAAKVETELNVLKTAISAAPVTPTDGGAAFKAAIVASLAAWPAPVGATKVKGE